MSDILNNGRVVQLLMKLLVECKKANELSEKTYRLLTAITRNDADGPSVVYTSPLKEHIKE